MLDLNEEKIEMLTELLDQKKYSDFIHFIDGVAQAAQPMQASGFFIKAKWYPRLLTSLG